MSHLLKFLLIFICFEQIQAATDSDCYKFEGCIGSSGGRGGAVSSNPSFGNQIRLNPSAVPTGGGLGLEGIYYKSDTDLSLAKGLGRVGAGISPSNSEETFFGPPALEVDYDLLNRKLEGKKYKQQKLTLATAFNIFKSRMPGVGPATLQVGVMGKYNYLTSGISPGYGINGTLGPLSYNYSIYQDESQRPDYFGNYSVPTTVKYKVNSMGLGLYLGPLLLDYSLLSMTETESEKFMTVRLTNASLIINKFLITASRRDEDSYRPIYNFQSKLLETQQQKVEYFGGMQIFAAKHLMVGFLYNYYLLREFSFIGTFFF